jgi:hypothetical protein
MRRRSLMITLDFALRGVASVVVALPLVAAVAGTGLGRFPEGERLLLQPGGVYLAEVARLLLPTLPSLLASSTVTAFVLSFALLVPHAALLVALAEPEETPRAAFWGRALERLPTLFAVTAFALLAELAILLVFAGLATMAGRAASDARTGDLAATFVMLTGVILATAVGLARDLARAGAIVHGLDGPASIRRGLHTLATRAGAALPAWLGPVLVSWIVVGAAALFVGALDASRPEAWRAWLVLAVHQGAAFALAWCRALWLSSSLDIVSRPS